MDLIKKIGLNLDANGITNIVGSAGSGKTNLSIIIGSEKLKNGGNVVFITDESQPRDVLLKFKKALKNQTLDDKKLRIKKIKYDCVDLLDIIIRINDNVKIDLLILDLSFFYDIFTIREIAIQYKIPIIFTSQAKTIIGEISQISPISSIKKAQISDYIISIKGGSNFKLLNKIINFLLFWKKKPTHTLKIIKNRYGKEGSYPVNVNFDKMIIR